MTDAQLDQLITYFDREYTFSDRDVLLEMARELKRARDRLSGIANIILPGLIDFWEAAGSFTKQTCGELRRLIHGDQRDQH